MDIPYIFLIYFIYIYIYVLNIFHIFSFVCFVIYSANRFKSNFLIRGVVACRSNVFFLFYHYCIPKVRMQNYSEFNGNLAN